MPCFKCPNQACQYASGWMNTTIFTCEKCGKGMVLKKTKKGKYFCSCSNFPNCKTSAFFPDYILECRPKTEPCQKCKNRNVNSLLVELKFDQNNELLPIGIQIILDMEPNGAVFCLVPGCDKNLEEMGYQYARNQIGEDSGNSHTNNRGEGRGNQGNNNNNPYTCYICGKPGHMANNCSNKQQQSTLNNYFNKKNDQNKTRPFNHQNKTNKEERKNANFEVRPNEGQKQGIICYKCGEQGHFANKCSNNAQNVNRNNNSMNFSNQNNNLNKQYNNYNKGGINANTMNDFNNDSIKCYKCGQPGHYASTCSSGQFQNFKNNNFSENNYDNNLQRQNTTKSSIVCYHCKEPGHVSTNCPNKGNSFNNNSQFAQTTKRNYKEIKNGKNTNKGKKLCKICGVGRHPKGSLCPGINKRKKKGFEENDGDDFGMEDEQ